MNALQLLAEQRRDDDEDDAPTGQRLLALPGTWSFAADGTEVQLDYTGEPITELVEGAEPLKVGARLRVRYTAHRVTRRGVINTWSHTDGSGAFERLGMPRGARRLGP